MSSGLQDDEEITLLPEWWVELGLCCGGVEVSSATVI